MSSQHPDNSPPAQKAIGSLAKKQSDVTRQGTHKLKFIPTLPNRRKKEEVKSEPIPSVIPPPSSERGRGRGRGRGDGGGRGRGRGAAPPVLEMTASGPFAMGPSLAGSSSRRAPAKSAFVPGVPTVASPSAALGAGLSKSAAPSLKNEFSEKGKGKTEKTADDEEVYSEPDEGVEIVDMQRIREMDWMAPESIQKEQQAKKKIKKEPAESVVAGDIDLANALDLSESESEDEYEQELEDIIEEFASRAHVEDNGEMVEDRLYLFQFPDPFPTFTSNESVATTPISASTDGKKVSFAADVNSRDASVSSATSKVPTDATTETHQVVDGRIGSLEVYRNGAVKLRLANNILLDINPATQPSFLQQAVHLDQAAKRLIVLGGVNKQFVVSPDVEELLKTLEEERHITPKIEGEEGLIKMDVDK